ncbi:TetR/AcrR family transcriptional regulator [Pseudonocardia sp. TRM90224]|uniref:TetR/AcrR family transcriptional regulator n=1 Tax=Pseudonocardia sp. TRM90224 TaxID=2812678 RepID=UPI001E492FF3|nr:TetR/AcrR family transcriptional regulator [Pseudonocardia sp. TRM90224]
MPRTSVQTRSHLLEIAGRLFYANGIRATGVDLVAAEAGVAPTTLYRQFASKDDLVGAYVEHAFDDFRAAFDAAVAAAGADPHERIMAAVDVVCAEVDSEHFRGCSLMMTLAEFPDPELPAHRNAVAAKTWMRQSFGELAAQLGVERPDELADHLMLVVEGARATGQALGPTGPARQARDLAGSIVAAAQR